MTYMVKEKKVHLRKGFYTMNRLIIIGNGFDLAHGLPTSYKDFIDDFWKNIKNKFGHLINLKKESNTFNG